MVSLFFLFTFFFFNDTATTEILTGVQTCSFFFFNETAPTEISTLSLHDALPISVLHRPFATRAGWLPNLTERGKPPSPARARAARAWLGKKLGGSAAPIWILPCRLLRRKNIDRKSTRLNSSH